MNYGRYEIIKELGRGSMGMVYQALDPQIERLVALKVLRPDRVSSEAFVQRFLREAKAIGRLSHPNIVTVFDAGEDQGTVYIAMEFLEGKPLNEVIEEKIFDLKEAVNLVIQVAETIDYAHQKGIVHRDLKPSNIILQANGQVKITDFGIAHFEDTSASLQTQAGEILGTPAYMSPEQVLSRPVDGRSDLFSLGIILYEFATGKRPFGGKTLASVLNAITQETPAPPEEVNPAIPDELSRIILKSLDKRPEERFQTGKALSEALRNFLKGMEPKIIVPGTPLKRSKNIFILVSAVVLLTGIAAGIYTFIPKGKAPPVVEKERLATLKIQSIPEGAQLFVDGTLKGETPIKLELPVGKHEVRLTLPDFHDWEAQVQLLKEKSETPLFIRLIPFDEAKP